MRLSIEPADFRDPSLGAFLHGHLDELAPTAPAESRHALDLDHLQAADIRLWVAYDRAGIVVVAARRLRRLTARRAVEGGLVPMNMRKRRDPRRRAADTALRNRL